MSLVSRILEHSRNARVPRVGDPETHEKIPYGTAAPMAVRIGAWVLQTSWANRYRLKWVAAITGSASTWLKAKGASEYDVAQILLGLTSALSFLYEQAASYLNSKATMRIPPHIGGQGFAPALNDPLPLPVRVMRENARRDKAEEFDPELAEFRANLRPLNPSPVMPSEAEQEETRRKLEGVWVSWKDAQGNVQEQRSDSLPEAITLRTHLRDTIDPFAKLK